MPQENEEWKNEEQDDVENEEGGVEEIATDLENLRIALIELLNKLPATTTEITKKELFDKLKVRKGRTEKLDQVKQMIAEIRPSLILRERKERVVKKEIKYPNKFTTFRGYKWFHIAVNFFNSSKINVIFKKNVCFLFKYSVFCKMSESVCKRSGRWGERSAYFEMEAITHFIKRRTNIFDKNNL